MKKQYWIALVLGSTFTGSLFVPIIADDGSGCNAYDPSGVNCYMPQLYHQNQILIQEQNQTNHLLAYNYCKGTPTIFTIDHIPTQQEMLKLKNSGILNNNPFQDCVNKVIGDTK